METTFKRIVALSTVEAEAAWSDGKRLARYGWLNEVPGLFFGLLTIAYIVRSLMALA